MKLYKERKTKKEKKKFKTKKCEKKQKPNKSAPVGAFFFCVYSAEHLFSLPVKLDV